MRTPQREFPADRRSAPPRMSKAAIGLFVCMPAGLLLIRALLPPLTVVVTIVS